MSSILVALRRLREDRAPAIGLALLVLATATVFGVAPRLLTQVGDDALHGVVAGATAFTRNVALIQEQVLPAGDEQPLGPVEDRGDVLDRQIPDAVRSLFATRRTVVDSARFDILGKTPDPSFIRFRIQPGAEERIHFVTGIAPTAATATVVLPEELRDRAPRQDPPSTDPIKVVALEAAISTDAAHVIDRKAGDLLFLSFDSDDTLGRQTTGLAAVRITGTFEVNDAADPFWYEDQSINHPGFRSPGGDAKLIDAGALMAVDAYDALVREGTPIRLTWRHFVDPDRLASARLDGLISDLRRLEAEFPQTALTPTSIDDTAMQTGLLNLLTVHSARWTSATAILTVVAIGPAAVAFAALTLVATMAARRRRPAIALVRGRGATLGQIIRAVLLEGGVIAIPALAVAILLAVLLIPAGSTRTTILAASVVAVVAVALLVATALPATRMVAAATRDDDAPPRGVSARRIVLDIVVIVIAAGGAYLLRERGIRGSSSTGTLSAADPLIAAVPALAGIAAGLTAIRLVPLPLRLLGRIASRSRGFVALLALRRAVHGGTTAAVLIVLLATASIGAFSSSALVHLDRVSAAASWQQVGAPIRISSIAGSLPHALDPTARDTVPLPGVRAAAGLFRTQVLVGPRNAQVQLVAIDLGPYAEMVAGTPADPALPPEMLAGDVPDGVVPMLVAQSLADRTDGAPLGKVVEIIVEGYHFLVRPIAARTTFPSLAPDLTFGIVNRQQLRSVHPDAPLAASAAFVDAPDSGLAAIRAAVAVQSPTAKVESRSAVGAAFDDSPVTAAIVTGIAVAALIAAAYAALAVTSALTLAGAARATEVAHLRMIGLSRRDALGLAIVEHGPTVVLAFAAGVALGLGLFALLEPGLGLDAIVGSRIEVPLTADPTQLAITAAAVLAIAAVGIGLAAWMQRRGVAVLALRRGFE